MSHSFVDTQGREWKLALDFDLHEQVYEREKVMLLSLGDNNCELLARLHTDVKLLVNVLWVLCEEQAAALGIVGTDEMPATRQFAKGFGGDVLENAAAALVAAVIDFFPNQEQRLALSTLMEKARATGSLLTQAMLTKIQALDPNLLAQNYVDSATNSPPSQESAIPALPAA